MKMFGFWVLLLLAEVALMFLSLAGSSAQETSSLISEDNVVATPSIRELMERSDSQKINKPKINLEDYSQIDPAPSSPAAVTSGRIEHGTPLMPYIPKLTPPYHPKHGGFSLPPSPV